VKCTVCMRESRCYNNHKSLYLCVIIILEAHYTRIFPSIQRNYYTHLIHCLAKSQSPVRATEILCGFFCFASLLVLMRFHLNEILLLFFLLAVATRKFSLILLLSLCFSRSVSLLCCFLCITFFMLSFLPSSTHNNHTQTHTIGRLLRLGIIF
jgi:hypothetical protein